MVKSSDVPTVAGITATLITFVLIGICIRRVRATRGRIRRSKSTAKQIQNMQTASAAQQESHATIWSSIVEAGLAGMRPALAGPWSATHEIDLAEVRPQTTTSLPARAEIETALQEPTPALVTVPLSAPVDSLPPYERVDSRLPSTGLPVTQQSNDSGLPPPYSPSS